MKIVCFSASLFVLLFACDASDEPKCKEGESYEKECNTCTCTDTGLYVCTQRSCYDGPQFSDTEPLTTTELYEEHTELSDTNGQVCTPNETKMKDCNRCKCSANGIVWICTRRFCPTSPPKIPVNEPGFTCEPNKMFMDDCNSCSCDESGTLARCTAMACDPNERQKRSNVATFAASTEFPKGNDCVPGTRWKQSCNWCFCSDNGFAACTLRGCLELHQQKQHKLHPKPIDADDSVKTTALPEDVVAQDSKVAGSRRVQRQTRGETNQKIFQKTVKPIELIQPDSNQAFLDENQKGRNCARTSDKLFQCKLTEHENAAEPQDHGTIVSQLNKQKSSGQNSQGSTEQKRNQSPTTDSLEPTPESQTISTTKRPNDYGARSEHSFTEEQTKDPNFRCTPNMSYKVDCKTCWCDATGKKIRKCPGLSSCKRTTTTIKPVDIESTATTIKSITRSTPEVSYTEDEVSDPNFKCAPSSSFKVACNTCWCASNGKGVKLCSRQACNPKTYPPLAPRN